MNEHEKAIFEELKEIFGAIEEATDPDEEFERFMAERNRLELLYRWNLDDYVKHYAKLKAYALDEKLISELEWLIVISLEFNKEVFLGSEFYKQFKDHKVVQSAFLEYERVKIGVNILINHFTN
ncbi:MAG: hypothetical protein WD509_02690 [Candidatus Paceibacterota bacterium]